MTASIYVNLQDGTLEENGRRAGLECDLDFRGGPRQNQACCCTGAGSWRMAAVSLPSGLSSSCSIFETVCISLLSGADFRLQQSGLRRARRKSGIAQENSGVEPVDGLTVPVAPAGVEIERARVRSGADHAPQPTIMSSHGW